MRQEAEDLVSETMVRAFERWRQFKEYRTALLISDVHGLRYAEIAKVLGVPEGTVESRLFRGRRILQGKLRGSAEEMGYLKASAASAG